MNNGGETVLAHENMRKRLILGLIGFGFMGILAVGGFFLFRRHQLEMANECLHDIRSLSLGTSTFADAQRLAEKYDGQPWSGPSRRPECSSQDCMLRFVFENALLKYLHPQQTVSLILGLRVKDGFIVGKEIDYTTMATSYDPLFGYVLFDQLTSITTHGYEVKRLQVDGHNVAHFLKVSLSPNTPGEVRRQAYSLNLSCLASFHPCRSESDVFPVGL